MSAAGLVNGKELATRGARARASCRSAFAGWPDPSLAATALPLRFFKKPRAGVTSAFMCGRVTQKSNPNRLGLGLTTVNLVEPLYGLPPKYNGAPGQEHWVIRQHPKTGERTLDRLWWGLIPYWCKDASGGRKPINAKGETVATLPSFRDAYRRRRCLLPVDNFFEWKATKGAKTKQPFAIAMASGK